MIKEVDHINVVKLKNVYEDTRYYYIASELCEGGELPAPYLCYVQGSEG